MTVAERSFIMVDESSDRIMLNDQLENLLRKEMRPILWFRDGLFCVMPKEILKNMLDAIMPFEQWIHWSQGEPISHNAGYFLAGIDCSVNNKGTNDGS